MNGRGSGQNERERQNTFTETFLSYTQFLSQIAESIPQLVWTCAPGGECDFLNQNFCNYAGIKLEDLVGYQWLPVIHPDDRDECLKRWYRALETGEGYEMEYRLRRHDGVYRWHLGRGVPVLEDGEIVKWFGTCTDIEDQKQNQIMLQSVMDNISQSIFWKDENLSFLGCNKLFAENFGVSSPKDLIGKNDYDLPVPKEQADFFRACDRYVMENNKPEYHIIEPQLRPDGSTAWLDTSKIPLHNSNGEVIGILGMYEDVTERENLIKQREDFMASLAHDLKIPIVGAMKVLEAINKGTTGAVNEEQSKLLTTLLSSHENLLQMINNLLQVLKYEANADELYFSKFDLVALLKECANEMESLAESKGLSIKANMPDNAQIEGDRLALRRVVQSLLANAFDYTFPSSVVSLNLRIEEDSSLVLEVHNFGEPIARDDLDSLFQRFWQGTRFGVGTGLGLYLSRQIVEGHGGKISCVSSKENGTTICAHLPRKALPVQPMRLRRSHLSVSR